MADAPEPLDELIGAIADGKRVDWRRYDGASPIDPAVLDAARSIARLRDATSGHGGDAAAGAGPSTHPDPIEGFELHEELGRGAFGRVVRARDRALGRDVALKILVDDDLTPEQRANFLREARQLAACRHPGIVGVHSIDRRAGRLELCLELIDGVTLEKLVAEQGPRSTEEAARVGVDVCRALAAMHAQELIHRDVKPANVMREKGGRIVLLDFGLAHSLDRAQRLGPLAGGTPRLMAPELLDKSAKLDGRVDLYALGVMLYWLVCGQWPFEGSSRTELFEKVVHTPPIPLIDRRADLPAAFVAIVEKALERDPARRFASAGEMERALRDFLSARGAADPPRPGAPQPERSRALLASAAIGLLALLLGAGWWLRPLRASIEVALLTTDGMHPVTAETRLVLGNLVVGNVTLNRAAYVYGFNVDRDDRYYAIFPMQGTTLKNPLPAGVNELPGRNAEQTELGWKITSPSTEEEFVFFVSRDADPALQAAWETCPKPDDGRDRMTGAELREKITGGPARGAGGLGSIARALPKNGGQRLIEDLKLLARDGAGSSLRVLDVKLAGAGR